jgi:hypothetical protein
MRRRWEKVPRGRGKINSSERIKILLLLLFNFRMPERECNILGPRKF